MRFSPGCLCCDETCECAGCEGLPLPANLFATPSLTCGDFSSTLAITLSGCLGPTFDSAWPAGGGCVQIGSNYYIITFACQPSGTFTFVISKRTNSTCNFITWTIEAQLFLVNSCSPVNIEFGTFTLIAGSLGADCPDYESLVVTVTE